MNENIKEIIEGLHPIEKKILKILKEKRKLDFNTLKEISKEKEDTLYKFLFWLEKKGLIKLSKDVIEYYILTEKAKKGLEEGFPEEKLIKILKEKGEISLKEIKERLGKDLGVAIGILKKDKVIEIKDGVIVLKDKNYIPKVRKLIKNLNKLDKDEINYLLSRGLIKREKKTIIRNIEIREDILNVLDKIELEDEIGVLTIDILEKKEWKKKKLRKFNIYEEVPRIYFGRRHPYEQFLREIKEKLVELGFKEMKNLYGPIIETMFYNCDALFMPQNHPARSIHDIFYIRNPKYGNIEEEKIKKVEKVHLERWGFFSKEETKRLVLRSQCTAISARELFSNLEIPGKYFAIARVFRPDTIDWKHFIEFEQLEGIIIDYNLNFRNLLGILKQLISKIFGIEEVIFKPGYFPFTEPSVEAYVKTKKGLVEVGGAGIFRPEVVKPALGKFIPVLAWGLGIGRLYMAKYNIEDIRELYTTDIDFLRNAKI